MSKLYRTATGKVVDLDQLMLRNEDSIAVGNMKVNARGDELGPGGKVVKTRNQRVSEAYKLHGMVPVDDVIHPDIASATNANKRPAAPVKKPVVEQSEPLAKEKPANTNKRQRGGLAAAIAKSREIDNDSVEAPEKKVKRIQNGGQ